MARYFAIKNNKIHSIALFEETPVNTKDVTYIDYTPSYEVGDKYNTETNTFENSLKKLPLQITTTIVSQSILDENNWIKADLIGLYTTGSEGEVIDATTSSIEVLFNKNIEELSGSYWDFGGGIVTNYTSVPNGCTFDIKYFIPNNANNSSKEIIIPKNKIKSLEGEYLIESALSSWSFTYLPILSGSAELSGSIE